MFSYIWVELVKTEPYISPSAFDHFAGHLRGLFFFFFTEINTFLWDNRSIGLKEVKKRSSLLMTESHSSTHSLITILQPFINFRARITIIPQSFDETYSKPERNDLYMSTWLNRAMRRKTLKEATKETHFSCPQIPPSMIGQPTVFCFLVF